MARAVFFILLSWSTRMGYRVIVSLLLIVSTTACSSLMGDRQARDDVLAYYLNLPERLVLYYPGPLQVDEQLKVLFSENISAPLVQQFPATATRGLIEDFLTSVPQLADGSTRIVDPHEWRSISQSPGTPVLFFYASWKMAYQRLPLNVHKQKLQAGAIAKVIPLGQVLAGKATITWRTAAWEDDCQLDAYEGGYFPVREWAENDAGKLHEGMRAVQEFCGKGLGSRFEQSLLLAVDR
jgi:hypothetical protein